MPSAYLRAPRSADRYPNSSCRQFCLFGTQPLHLADHIVVAGLAQARFPAIPCEPGTSRRCWRAGAHGRRPSGPENPFRSSSFRKRVSTAGPHRVLQSEGVESHVVDPSSIATSAPTAARQDRQDRRRGPASRVTGV